MPNKQKIAIEEKEQMEGFWGILKREHYHGKHFTGKKELVDRIENDMRYYNNRRVQRNLGVLTPIEKQNHYFAAQQNRKNRLVTAAANRFLRLPQHRSAVNFL